MTFTNQLRKPIKPSALPTAISAEGIFPTLEIGRILILSALGGMVWLVIISNKAYGGWIGVVFVMVLLLRSVVLLNKGKIAESLSFLMYLAMIEPLIRYNVLTLPYHTLEYFFLLWVILALRKYKLSRLGAPALFYAVYVGFEIVGYFRAFDFNVARGILVSSMTIGFALLLTDKLNLNKKNLPQLFMALVIGAFHLSVAIIRNYVTKTVHWDTNSNFSASAGMGPVQISMLLAMAVIILLLLADRVPFAHQLIYTLFAAGFGLLMILTFSRNGLYLTVIALATYYFLFSRFSWRTLFAVILLSVIGMYLYQYSIQVAGPALTERYSDTNTTGRDILVKAGWKIFLDNPVWGVGTSNYFQVVASKEYFGRESGAHNELIRAAAEHGIFGLSTWLLFLLTCVWLGFRKFQGKTRALRMVLLIVFFAYLSVNGLKLLIQPIILLIALSIDEF